MLTVDGHCIIYIFLVVFVFRICPTIKKLTCFLLIHSLATSYPLTNSTLSILDVAVSTEGAVGPPVYCLCLSA